MKASKFECTDCYVIFYLEEKGHLNGYPATCPVCDENNAILIHGEVTIDER